MRRFMVVAAVLTAFSQSSTTVLGDSPPPRPRPPIIIEPRPPQPVQGDLCRRAPPLAQMAAENQGQPEPRPGRWTPRSGDKPAVMSPPPSPIVTEREYSGALPSAPPAPVAMPAPASAPEPSSSSDSAIGGIAVSASARPSSTSPSGSPSGGRAFASKRAAGGPPIVMPTPRPTPERGGANQQVQSGQLTAGEHDDLLNPALYARYVNQFLAGETLQGIPRVDTGKALTVVVTDRAGAPVPFATVTLTCADNNTLSLTTMADGRATFFPELDRLGTNVRMVATSGNGNATPVRTLNVADVRGAQTVRTQISARAPRVTQFDLAVVIDATGSMGDEINFLKAELADIIATLSRRHQGLDIRVAMVVYRDQGDEFVTRTFEFTNNIAEVQRNLSAQSAGGGGDTPEAMEVAMARAVGLNWRTNSVKSMLLVADAPPHSGDVPATWAATEVARAKRIQIVPVAASGVDDAAQYIMRAMAASTQSRYAFLTNDSGIGNPHAEPSVDCYHVTKLDSLVRRILDAQISGRRIEPATSEIVRTVGDYDNGRCRGQ